MKRACLVIVALVAPNAIGCAWGEAKYVQPEAVPAAWAVVPEGPCAAPSPSTSTPATTAPIKPPE